LMQTTREEVEAASATVQVRIFRFVPGEDAQPRYESYEVPWAPRMRILDALEWVNEELGAGVAYRWYCGVKKCGLCAVTMNGKPVLACWQAAEREMTIEPLAGLPLIRDLVVDRSDYEERVRRLMPYLVRDGGYEGFPEKLSDTDMRPTEALRDCIQCLVCYAACPVIAVGDRGFVGPAALVKVAESALDPRDGGKRGKLLEREGEISKCVWCYSCQEACPCEIPIVWAAIEPLRRLAAKEAEGVEARRVRSFVRLVTGVGKVVPGLLVVLALGVRRAVSEWWRALVYMLPRGKLAAGAVLRAGVKLWVRGGRPGRARGGCDKV
jgi:fumarate reductase (CoM/CoB) subunit B